MNVRRARRALWGLGLLAGAAALVVICWAVLAPYDSPMPVSPRQVSSVGPRRPAGRNQAKPAGWETLWAKPLRRSLHGPPAKEAEANERASAQRAPPPNIALLGTMVEEGFSKAMFLTTGGMVELKGVGETLGIGPGGPEVVEIGLKEVVIRHQGAPITLRLKGADGQ